MATESNSRVEMWNLMKVSLSLSARVQFRKQKMNKILEERRRLTFSWTYNLPLPLRNPYPAHSLQAPRYHPRHMPPVLLRLHPHRQKPLEISMATSVPIIL